MELSLRTAVQRPTVTAPVAPALRVYPGKCQNKPGGANRPWSLNKENCSTGEHGAYARPLPRQAPLLATPIANPLQGGRPERPGLFFS